MLIIFLSKKLANGRLDLIAGSLPCHWLWTFHAVCICICTPHLLWCHLDFIWKKHRKPRKKDPVRLKSKTWYCFVLALCQAYQCERLKVGRSSSLRRSKSGRDKFCLISFSVCSDFLQPTLTRINNSASLDSRCRYCCCTILTFHSVLVAECWLLIAECYQLNVGIKNCNASTPPLSPLPGTIQHSFEWIFTQDTYVSIRP